MQMRRIGGKIGIEPHAGVEVANQVGIERAIAVGREWVARPQDWKPILFTAGMKRIAIAGAKNIATRGAAIKQDKA